MIDIRKNQDLNEHIDPELNLEAEADAIADEILEELDLTSEREAMTDTSCVIHVGHANGDILSESEMDLEKVARLRALVRSGQYRVNTGALAAALLASGDLA